MKCARWLAGLLAVGSMPALASTHLASWQVYQQGAALELAIDRNAIWQEPDGLTHFVNQERFAKRQYDKHYRINYWIRRTTGFADCQKSQYVLTSTDFYTDTNRHVWSTLYPLPRYAWKWMPVEADSVAATMIDLVCNTPTTRKKPE